MRRFKPRNYSGVSAGRYPWIPVDSHGFEIGYVLFHGGEIEVSGSKIVSANIEGTYDDVFTQTSCKAFALVTANQVSGTIDGWITQPVMAIRLSYNAVTVSAFVTSVVSGGLKATFQIQQRVGEPE